MGEQQVWELSGGGLESEALGQGNGTGTEWLMTQVRDLGTDLCMGLKSWCIVSVFY